MKFALNPRLFKAEPMQRCCLHECHAACCEFGTWIDKCQAEELAVNADWIRPHMPADRRDPSRWFEGVEEYDRFVPSGLVVHTATVDNPHHAAGRSCVFLRPDAKCALQVAAQEAGLHPWHFKPFYCVLHPLDLDEQGRITLDETEECLRIPGSCLRPAAEAISLLDTFEPELRYLLGNEAYEQLKSNRSADQK